MDNKIELKFNAGQSKSIDKGISYLIKHGMAEDVTDQKYVEEVVPKSTGYQVRVYHLFVQSGYVIVRKWRNVEIEKECPQAKSVIYKVSMIGLIRILSSRTISNYFNKVGVNYSEGDTIESIVKKVFPDAEVIK